MPVQRFFSGIAENVRDFFSYFGDTAELKKENKDVALSDLGLKLPVVVKPCAGGSSIGVYIVDTEEAYRDAIENSFADGDEVVIEPYIIAKKNPVNA